MAAVQFEYGYAATMPRRVDFRPYTLFDERFFGPNLLAVHHARRDLMTLLSGGKPPVAVPARQPKPSQSARTPHVAPDVDQ